MPKQVACMLVEKDRKCVNFPLQSAVPHGMTRSGGQGFWHAEAQLVENGGELGLLVRRSGFYETSLVRPPGPSKAASGLRGGDLHGLLPASARLRLVGRSALAQSPPKAEREAALETF